LVVGLLIILASDSAWSSERDKTDVVTLKNGDRISGDIKSFEHGILVLSTDNMSTLNIEWPAVRSLASKYAFGVERTGGVKYFGLIATTDDGARLIVRTDKEAVEIPMAQVERISQFSPRFWDRINGNLAVGFTYTKSSSISVGSVNFDSHYRSTTVDGSLYASSNVTTSPTDGTTQRYVLSTAVNFLRQGPNLWGVIASAEQDKALGIDARLLAGATLGRRFVQTPITELTGSAGVVATQEWAAGSSQSTTNLEGVISISWQVFKYIDPKTTMDLNLAFFPSLTDSGRYRSAGNLNLIHKFIGDVTVGITAYMSYDNRPPEPGAATSDYGVTFNVGYSFGQ
jgi:hypothetical protein